MKKVFILENLGCAHCAAKMEEAISKLDGVEKVNINFLTQKMVLTAQDDRFDELLEQAKKIIVNQEPEVVVTAK